MASPGGSHFSIRLTQKPNGLYIKPINAPLTDLVYYCLEKKDYIPMVPWTMVDARMSKQFDKMVLGVFSDATSLHIYMQNHYIKCNINTAVNKYQEAVRVNTLKKTILENNLLVEQLKKVTPKLSKQSFDIVSSRKAIEELSKGSLISGIDTISEFGYCGNNRATSIKYTNPNEVLKLIDEYMVSGNSDILSDMVYMTVSCKYAVLSYLKTYLNRFGNSSNATTRFLVLINLICTQSEIDYLLSSADLDDTETDL